jgi:hypothetical protein
MPGNSMSWGWEVPTWALKDRKNSARYASGKVFQAEGFHPARQLDFHSNLFVTLASPTPRLRMS